MPSAKPISVLIVEDETLIRLLAGDTLRDEGFDVATAVNAADAISLLEGGTHFDFVFTDITMPGTMNGLGLGTWIRTHRPETQVVFTSGVARSSLLGSGLAEGDAFYAKPVNFDRLIHHLRKAAPTAAPASILNAATGN